MQSILGLHKTYGMCSRGEEREGLRQLGEEQKWKKREKDIKVDGCT